MSKNKERKEAKCYILSECCVWIFLPQNATQILRSMLPAWSEVYVELDCSKSKGLLFLIIYNGQRNC